MERLKAMLSGFMGNALGFFKTEDGAWNKKAILAVIIGGFVGWLVITLTFGAKLKRVLKKVPVVGSLFPKAKRVVRRTASRAKTAYRKRTRRK